MTSRPAAVLAAALALSGGLVLWDPYAPSAAAYSTVPPITLPSSTVASLAGSASGTVVSEGLVASGGTGVVTGVAGNGAKAAVLGSSAASSTVVAGGWIVGTYVGTQIAKFTGLPTSGDISCDAGRLFGWDTSCGLGPNESYLVNSDVSLTEPGWTNGNSVTPANGGSAWRGSFDLIAPSEPYLATYPVTTGWAYSGVIPSYVYNGQDNNDSVNARFVFVRVSDGATAAKTQVFRVSSYPDSPTSASVTSSPYSGYGFDHLDVYDNESGFTTTFYPVGHVDRPADVSPDPNRYWRTSWSCSDGASHVLLSDVFTETSSSWPAYPSASCSTGAVTSILVEQLTDGLDATTMVQWEMPAEAASWYENNPTCWDGSCKLDIARVDPVTGSRVSCLSNPSACVDWYTDPAKADNYECTYGGSAVGLAECDVYRPTFNVATGVDVTNDQGQKMPAAATEPYGDTSADGNPVPRPSGSSDPSPDPDSGPSASDSCPPPFSWSALFNTWWLFKATSCALQETFVPEPGTIDDELARIQDGAGDRAPFSVLATVPVAFTGFGSAFGDADCSGMPNFSAIDGAPLVMPCEPPDSSAWRVGYALMQGILWVGLGFGVWRMGLSAVGAK